MAYIRRTKDWYEIQSFNGGIWDTESNNETMREARKELKEYNDNGYHNVRIKKVRVKING